ncbi:hypothetical protein RFI_20195, partial [Reticulomyxa filosa]
SSSSSSPSSFSSSSSSSSSSTQCYCDECIPDHQVPLRFKLQLFDDQLESKQLQQLTTSNRKALRASRKKLLAKNLQNKRQNQKKRLNNSQDADGDKELKALEFSGSLDLSEYWSGLDMNDKWRLTEMHLDELSELLTNCPQWEILRAAFCRYSKQQLANDLLVFPDGSSTVTICDDLIDSGGMEQ